MLATALPLIVMIVMIIREGFVISYYLRKRERIKKKPPLYSKMAVMKPRSSFTKHRD